MGKIQKKIGWALGAVLTSIIIISAVTVGITVENSRRGIGRDGVRAAITNNLVLFKMNGIDENVATQYRALCVSALNGGVTADVPAIMAANNNALPVIQLFDSVNGSGVNYNLAQLKYRLVYVTKIGNELVLTLFATASYRESHFASASVVGGNAANYNLDTTPSLANTAKVVNGVTEGGTVGCLVRNNLTNDFHTFLTTNLTAGGITGKYEYVTEYIKRPAIIPWQTSGQVDGRYNNYPVATKRYEDANNLLTGDRLNDLVWLPSAAELCWGGDLPNVWGVLLGTRTGFLHVKGGSDTTSVNYFLRSASLQPGGVSYGVMSINTGGAIDQTATFTHGDSGVRPAIHIVLQRGASSNITAGFSSNAITGAGAGITVN